LSKLNLLRNIPLFASLSDAELQLLADSLQRRSFARDTILFHKDSVDQTLYIIESGRVRIFILNPDGEEITVNVYGAGDFFGELALLDGQPRSAGAMVLEDAVLLALHRDDFLHHLQAHPDMIMTILKVLSARIRYTTAQAERLAFLDVSGRVAAKLLELADRYGVQGDGLEIGLELTQTQLASWVGANRKSVNRALANFRDQGLIHVERQKITILDPRALRRQIIY
jgi:CRP/FNR family cyclic AMP-dependent transcriptional regulator